MFIFSHQGNANQSYTDITFHPSQNGYHQENKKTQMNAGEDARKKIIQALSWECKLVSHYGN
jgi:hypothetical protein